MGYLVQGRIEVSIFIDDNEYPLMDTNTLNYLHIGTSVITGFPTLCFSITDVDRTIERIGLQDGIPIRVVLKSANSDTQIYLFRKFHHKKPPSSSAPTYIIDGYYDSPLWFAGSTNVNIRGSSNDVLQSIASTCGLKYAGASTNDAQLWTPQNKGWRQFAKEVTNNAYISDSSCMCLALDLDGTLKFVDVNNLPTPKRKIIAYEYADDAITAVDFTNSASSGFNNALSGYWNTRVKQSLTADALHTPIDQLQFTADVRAPLYNTAVKTQAKRGAVRFSPIDVGNLHENYERASYQNMRYRNLFSFGLSLLLNQSTTFQIFEKINFSVQKVDASQDTSTAGVYTITGRSLYINAANYAEKLQVVRHGTNETYVQG